MKSILKFIERLHQDQDGQGMVEYILVTGVIVFAAVAGSANLSSAINSAFGKVGAKINNAVS